MTTNSGLSVHGFAKIHISAVQQASDPALLGCGSQYDRVVRPVVDEVLQGYNCTVFAYGQTGTGKTYTMEGQLEGNNTSKDAGVVPRAVAQVFKHLEENEMEYQVSVSVPLVCHLRCYCIGYSIPSSEEVQVFACVQPPFKAHSLFSFSQSDRNLLLTPCQGTRFEIKQRAVLRLF